MAFYWMVAYLGWLYGREPPWGGVLIGFSRVCLGLHFMTDGLGGWIAGSAFFLIVLSAGTVLFYRPGLLYILESRVP